LFDDDGFKLDKFIKSQSILDIFDDLDYDTNDIQARLLSNISSKLQDIVKQALQDNSYLKTIFLQRQ